MQLDIYIPGCCFVDKVWKKIFASGEKLARKERSDFPLMYEWHEKKYLGAAHGFAGIFYTLMQYTQDRPGVIYLW